MPLYFGMGYSFCTNLMALLKMRETTPFYCIRIPPAVPVVLKSFSYAQSRRSGLPPSDEGGGFAVGEDGGRETRRENSLPQSQLALCQRSAERPVAALAVHRTAIPYRDCASLSLVRGGLGAYLTASAVVGQDAQAKENSMSL